MLAPVRWEAMAVEAVTTVRVRHRTWRGALACVALAILLPAMIGCQAERQETFTADMAKTTVAAGERVQINSLSGDIILSNLWGDYGHTTEKHAGSAFTWEVQPSTGRVTDGFFVADVPGTYYLWPSYQGHRWSGQIVITVGPAPDPLVGTWSWTTYTARQKWSPKTGVDLRNWEWKPNPKPQKFQIYDKDGVLFVKAGWPEQARITTDGANVSFVVFTKSANSADWDRQTYAGVLDGNKITGTALYEEWIDFSGAGGGKKATPPKPHTAAWTATKVQ
jgi:hypothetical protein